MKMGLFEDNTFTTVLPDNTKINVPDNLYVETSIDDKSGFKTVLQRCWATPR